MDLDFALIANAKNLPPIDNLQKGNVTKLFDIPEQAVKRCPLI